MYQSNQQKPLTTVMCVLSYIGVLCVIPFLTQRHDGFIQFHAKQGLNLFIIEAVVFVACFILELFPFIGFIGNLLYSFSSLIFLALSIYGIVVSCQGQWKQLPIIGAVKIIK